jgi:hypothetical protein
VDEVRVLAARRKVDEKAILKKRPVTYGEIVEKAGDTIPGGNLAFVVTWKMCSGIARGDLWTTLNVLSREELPGAPRGIAHLKITANVNTLRFAVFFAVEMTAAGWRLYDERCRPPYGRAAERTYGQRVDVSRCLISYCGSVRRD